MTHDMHDKMMKVQGDPISLEKVAMMYAWGSTTCECCADNDDGLKQLMEEFYEWWEQTNGNN